jgi:hypothetical protein
VGLRLNNVHENKAADAKVDNNFIDSVYISGATDDRPAIPERPQTD